MDIRGTILGADDSDLKEVTIEQWGVKVYLKSFTLDEQTRFEKVLSDEDNKDMPAEIVVLGVVDKKGEAVFSDEDVEKLSKKNAKVIYDLFKKIVDHNTPDDQDTTEKN